MHYTVIYNYFFTLVFSKRTKIKTFYLNCNLNSNARQNIDEVVYKHQQRLSGEKRRKVI